MRQEPYQDELAAIPFHEVIDVRSPSEYALDHVPGAINLPVLSDEERAVVGTIYTREDRFRARCVGAAMVSRNLAGMLEAHFAQKPTDYQPLVYCWRGGQRSRSLATVLEAVGWRPVVIAGGYKSYRSYVRVKLAELAGKLQFRIVGGLTGSGKTGFLRRGRELGRQVLDLEDLAKHRGSLLGDDFQFPQPAQKLFESRVLQELVKMDPARPVFVESESKRIGRLQCPDALWAAMVAAPVVELEASAVARAEFLVDDYAHFVQSPQSLLAKFPVLHRLHGSEVVEGWKSQIAAGQWREFVESLLVIHYDPAYLRCRNFAPPARRFSLARVDLAEFDRVWQELPDE